MKSIKIILPIIILLTLAYPNHNITKKHLKRHKHSVRHINKNPRFNVRIGFNHKWGFWNHHWCNEHYRDVVVFKDEKEIELTVEEIISQIEDLAVLKEKELITEKEYEKAKKNLLKRI